jgi:hypothetical protein
MILMVMGFVSLGAVLKVRVKRIMGKKQLLMIYCIFISAYSLTISLADSIIRTWRGGTTLFPSTACGSLRIRTSHNNGARRRDHSFQFS